MQGADGVILFREPSSGELYPIRGFSNAGVESLSAEAPLLVIDFCVGDFPKSAQKLSQLLTNSRQAPSVHSERLSEICMTSVAAKGITMERMTAIRLVQTIDCDNVNDKHKLLHELLGEKSENDLEDEARWIRTIEALKDLEFMQFCCFLYLRQVSDKQGKMMPESRNRGFRSATAGTYYKAKITQYCLGESKLIKSEGATDALQPTLQIEMTADLEQIKVLEGKYTLDGRYDGCELTFKTETGAAGSSTVIRIAQAESVADTAAISGQFGYDRPPDGQSDQTFAKTPNSSAARAAFLPLITLDLDIRHAAWQRAVLFIGVLFLLGGFFLNTTDYKSSLLAKAKQAQIITVIIAIGATLTTWLGRDFWTSLFKRETFLWRFVTFFVDGWPVTLGLILVIIGSSLTGFLRSVINWVLSAGTKELSSVQKLISDHSFTIGVLVLLVGLVLIVSPVIKQIFKNRPSVRS
jgi:hypothetical protein